MHFMLLVDRTSSEARGEGRGERADDGTMCTASDSYYSRALAPKIARACVLSRFTAFFRRLPLVDGSFATNIETVATVGR